MPFRVFLLLLWIFFVCTTSAVAQIPADSIPPLVDSLIQLSRDYTHDTAFEEATALNEQAGEAARRCCGKKSAAYAAYYFNKGRILDFMGRNLESLPWYSESRELRGKLLGTDDLEYGKSCNNLAIAYDLLGRYEEAEPLYLEVLAIREAAHGRRSTRCAAVLANLGGMYSSMGEYDAAEQMILEALDIRKELLGERDDLYLQSLILLASHHLEIDNYQAAEPILLEAKRIYDEEEQPYFFDYVSVLEQLGSLYVATGDLEKAGNYLKQAAQLIENTLGKDNRLYISSLNYRAVWAFENKQLNESEAYLKEELATLEELGGESDEYYGIALQDLSRIYRTKGELEKALSTLEQGLSIYRQSIPATHNWYRQALWNKALILQALEDYPAAGNIMREIMKLEQQPLTNAVKHLSDQQLSAFTEEYYRYLSEGLVLAEQYPDITDLFYDRALLYKGFLLNNALVVRQNAQKNENSRTLYRQLRGLHRRLATLYSNFQADPTEIQDLEAQAEQLEKEMIRQQAQYQQLTFDLNWQTLQEQLSPDEVAIELLAYQRSSQINAPLETYYAALVLLPGSAKPTFVRLGKEETLEQLLDISTGNGEAISNLYHWNVQGEQLHQFVWQPIQAVLDQAPEIKKVFIASDGLLHRVNINAIPLAENKVVAQAYEIVMLTSTRDILSPGTTKDSSNRTALLYGGIDYGQVNDDNDSSLSHTSGSVATRGRAYSGALRGYDPKRNYWQDLPWTEVEIEYAKEVLQSAGYETTAFSKQAATEDQFKAFVEKRGAPGIIHLSTHGYFFEPPKKTTTNKLLPFEQAQKDLIRSGLILADGNYAWVHGHSRTPNSEDGILTALELSQLALNDTELVILSACETGLGKIQETEGVYGLQRALKLTGVRYIIISLWQVPDYQTQAFMSSFYLAWLEEGKPIPEAFRNAQAYMRARYKKAFDWAGFILIQ